MRLRYPFFKIGIIGGGQLAKMMLQEAKRMGFYIEIYDPNPNSPAAKMADKYINGSFNDEEKLYNFCLRNDYITYDLEHINTEPLKKAMIKNPNIYPSPYTLEIIQDKLKQKEFLKSKKIPIPNFSYFKDISELKKTNLKFPLVQKSRLGGYDGKGVRVIKNKKSLKDAIKNDFIIEDKIDIFKEIAVLGVRSQKGDIKLYEPCEMIFNKEGNLCDVVIAPARMDKKISINAKEIAYEIIKALNDIGVFAIEMFLSKNQKIYVNEIAPRPHNSGHYTIEACVTSQFEQHIRAIVGLPLGDTKLITPAVMVNLIGGKSMKGNPVIVGLENALKIKGFNFHFYGKEKIRPLRKMGHFTVISEKLNEALKKAIIAKKIIKLEGE